MITPCYLTRPLAGTNTANMVCCPVRFFALFFFLHSVGFGFGLLLLRRILLRLITIKAGLTLSSHFVWIHVLVTSFHIRSRHTYRQIQTRR